MSQPVAFHFQLDPNKPDEERVLQMLNEWQQAGWSLQKIMVTALLTLAQTLDEGGEHSLIVDIHDMIEQSTEYSEITLDEVHQVLAQVRELLEGLQDVSVTPVPAEDKSPLEDSKKEAVSESFIASVKKALKPGISLDD